MVIGAELYPPTGLKHYGSSAYTEEYYQNPPKTYAHIEEYAKEEDFFNNNNNRNHSAYITTPQSTKHGLVSHEGYANYQDNSYGYGYGAHAPANKPAYDSHSYAKYLNGMNHNEGYGYTQPPPSGYYGHGKGKQMNGMHHNENYETQQYETASYDNYQSEYNLQPHKQKKNWGTTGAEWISKGC